MTTPAPSGDSLSQWLANLKIPKAFSLTSGGISCKSHSRAPQACRLRRLLPRPSLAKPLRWDFSRQRSLQTRVQSVTSRALLLENLTEPAPRCDPGQGARRSFACIRRRNSPFCCPPSKPLLQSHGPQGIRSRPRGGAWLSVVKCLDPRPAHRRSLVNTR